MNRYVSEMIGTMVLVLMGCGSAVFAGDMPGAVTTGVGTLGVAIAFGLSVVAMAYAIGGISGCHINPAITLGMYCSGGMGGKDALLYIIFQIIGGILGSAVLFILVSTGPHSGPTMTGSNGFVEGKCCRPLSLRPSLRLFSFLWRWEPRIKRKGPVNWRAWSSG